MKFPLKLEKRLEDRKQENAFRSLEFYQDLTDFYSNDYLGFASSHKIFTNAGTILEEHKLVENGATGSRLLSGNHSLYSLTEDFLAEFHNAEAALIFNSGYDGNIGFFSSIPLKGDLIFYDEFIHASIRDGIRMSNAKALKFSHNDLEDLAAKLERIDKRQEKSEIYIVTESVFSMDGDSPNLEELVLLSEKYNCHLVVDEAHSTGVFGDQGEGLLQEKGLEQKVFARIVTFGKAMGCHGAVILGSSDLKDYLINFARSFIFTTALPPHSIATVLSAYQYLSNRAAGSFLLEDLGEKIIFFNEGIKRNGLENMFLPSNSAIHCCVIPGNQRVKQISEKLQAEGFGVKAILSPTVPAGKERLRFCIHSYNTQGEINRVLELLSKILDQ